MVADDEQSDGLPGDRAQYERLRAAGIVVRPDRKRSSLQHNKFMVVDGERVWTGSVNWTDSGMTYNQENALELRSPQIAAAYRREFEEMFIEMCIRDRAGTGRRRAARTAHAPGATASPGARPL